MIKILNIFFFKIILIFFFYTYRFYSSNKNINSKIIQMGDALRSLDKLQCASEIIDRIKKGQKIYLKEAEIKSKYLRLFDEKNKFIGILKNINGLVSPKRLISIEN